MAKCAGITQKGDRCTGTAEGSSAYCLMHDPDRAEERRALSAKGGRAKAEWRSNGEITEIKKAILELVDHVLSGEQDKSRAAVAGQLYNAVLRAVEIERKIHETEELEARLARLEEKYGIKPGGNRGA
jgi:hypothetical protein